jgi:hypothetical protein
MLPSHVMRLSLQCYNPLLTVTFGVTLVRQARKQGQKVPSGGGDIVAEGFARSQSWWPEFGDLRELIEGQELQRFEFKISRGG